MTEATEKQKMSEVEPSALASESAVAESAQFDSREKTAGSPPTRPDPRRRQEPVFPGASIGIPGQSAGTLGMKVIDHQTGQPMLLTAGFVLGEVQTRQEGVELVWQAGTPVLQPGPADGGTTDDKIGELARAVQNDVCDAGVAYLTGDRQVSSHFPDGTGISGLTVPRLGMHVKMYGITGYAESEIQQIDVTATIAYGPGARQFHNLFMTGKLSSAGDAGAMVLESETNRAVGMVIAGSETASLCVPVYTLIRELDIELAGVGPDGFIEEHAIEELTAVNDSVGIRIPDRLGYETYINAFVRLVRDPNTRPPLTIGIYGAWGSGKTFLMTRIMERLQGLSPLEAGAKERQGRPQRWWNRLWWRVRTSEVSPRSIVTALVVVMTIPLWGPLLLLYFLFTLISGAQKRLGAWARNPLRTRLGSGYTWFRAHGVAPLRARLLRLGRWFQDPLWGSTLAPGVPAEPRQARFGRRLRQVLLGDGDRRPDRVAVVHFNAWEYQASEKLWAGLVRNIFATIESHLGTYGRFTISFRRNLKRESARLRRQLLPYTLIAGTVLTVLIVGLLQIDQQGLALLVSVLGLPGLIRLLWELGSILRTPQSARIVALFDQPDYTQHLGFMAEIRDDLVALTEGLPKNLKVIVFVDDLDRCSAAKAVEVLEAIKLLLDFPRFIVFLGIDARIITHAIEEHYGATFAKAGVTGYEYLHKIVQIPFNIPEPGPDDIRRYLNSLLGAGDLEKGTLRSPEPEDAGVMKIQAAADTTGADKAAATSQDQPTPPDGGTAQPVEVGKPAGKAPDGRKGEAAVPPEWVVRKEVAFVKEERDAFRTFIPYMIPNPRHIKRLVNVYRMMRDLASAAGTVFRGPELEKVMTWLLLTEQWPYMSHLMLDCLDNDRQARHQDLLALHQAAAATLKKGRHPTLYRLDADPERLATMVRDYGARLARKDILALRGLTINFNPALRAEIQAGLPAGQDPRAGQA